jgi:hypothetical protein
MCAFVPGLAILVWVGLSWLLQRVFFSGWALMAAVLLLGAGEAFTVGSLSLLIKRMEARITKRLKQAGSLR